MDALRYAQLLSSRICHDLITPVGAIHSGFELLSSQEDSEGLLQLIHQSAETALRRLVYFRSAFGISSASTFSNLDPIQTLIKDYCEPLKISFLPSIKLTAPELINFPLWGRTLLNVTLIICDLASQGGVYKLCIEQDAHHMQIGITLEGSLFEMPADIQKALEGKLQEADLTPQTIQAFMTWELLNQLESQFVLNESHRSRLSCKLISVKQPHLYEATLF